MHPSLSILLLVPHLLLTHTCMYTDRSPNIYLDRLCRISGSDRPLRFEHWGAHGDCTFYLPASQRSKLLKELHKGHNIYTGSGHRCGVIPYSSVWLVDCLLGLMMITIQGRTASRGSVLGWGDELLGGVQPPFSLSLTLSACAPNE